MVTKKLNQKRTLRFCSVVLMLALCVSLFAGCAGDNAPFNDLNDSGTLSSENAVKAGTLLSTVYKDVLYIADPDGNVHTANFYGEVYYEQTSMDGYKYIAVDDDNYTLLYFNGEEILTLADKVAVAVMSADGNTIAYITVTDEDNNISQLRIYADGEETVIDTGTIVMCAVSPDGSAVGYTTEDEDGNYRTYYWNGTDDIHEIGKYRPIIAISNGGEYVYYAQLDENGWTESYYVQHGDDGASKVKMADTFSEDAIYFNYDGSELLFSDGENTYIFAKGQKRFDVSNGGLFPQFPESVIQCRSDHIGGGIITYSAASFANHYFFLGDKYDPDFVYMDQDYNAATILKHGHEGIIYICADGKSAFFCIGASKEYAYADPEVANAWAEEHYGYGIGTYRIHSDKLEEEPTYLYEKPWISISQNENIHYFESIEEVWNEEAQAYRASRVYYEVDVSKKNPQPVKLETEDVIYDKLHGVFLCNTDSNAIPEGAKFTAELNGTIIYWLDGDFYSYSEKNTYPVTSLEPYLEAYNFDYTEIWYTFYGTEEQYYEWISNLDTGDLPTTTQFIESDEQREEKQISLYEDRDACIDSYGNIFIAFTSRDAATNFLQGDKDKTALAGCYFSVDGINFVPLVENYIAEEN